MKNDFAREKWKKQYSEFPKKLFSWAKERKYVINLKLGH